METRGRTRDGSGDGREDGIREGEGEAEKRKGTAQELKTRCGKRGKLGWNFFFFKRRQERVGSVLIAADPDNLENGKETGEEAQGTQGLGKNCTSRESLSPLTRLIRGFRNRYHCSPLGGINASGD